MPALQQRADRHEAETLGDDDTFVELDTASAEPASTGYPDPFMTTGHRGYILYRNDRTGHLAEERKFEHGGIGCYE